MTTYAELLLDHMRTCMACVGAKIARIPPCKCKRAKELIRLTIKERHG